MEREALFDAQERREGLKRLIAAWELSATETADVFSTSPRTVSEWRSSPPDTIRGLALLLAATCILEDRGSEAVPALVRRPRKELNGWSLLETACQARHQRVLEAVLQQHGLRTGHEPVP